MIRINSPKALILILVHACCLIRSHRHVLPNPRSERLKVYLKFALQLLFLISNNIKVYEKPVPRTKKIPHYAVEFEAGEENRIVYESLGCVTTNYRQIWRPN